MTLVSLPTDKIAWRPALLTAMITEARWCMLQQHNINTKFKFNVHMFLRVQQSGKNKHAWTKTIKHTFGPQ